jgi:hypothetical protein
MKVRWLLPLLLGIAIARLWIMPLFSSFWVDEMATEFVVHRGANDPSLQVAPQVPQSIYYQLPRLAEHFFGMSEIVDRAPSLLALALALWILTRIAARLIHPRAGWITAFACLSLGGFNYQAADARPYALGSLVAAAGFLFLIRWLDRGIWTDAVAFIAAGALLWRVHLIFWPVYLIFAIYTLWRIVRKETPVQWIEAGAVFATLTILLLPILRNAIELNRAAGAHVVTEKPTLLELFNQLKLGLATVFFLSGAVLRRLFSWPRTLIKPLWAPILTWWLTQPLALFAFSWLTGNSVFVQRYLFVTVSGAALLAVAALAVFLPESAWHPAAAVAGIAIIILVGHWRHVGIPHHPSDWRDAARAVNDHAPDPSVPVICPSPFVEAQWPVWRPGYPVDTFLYSHLQVYQLKGGIYTFPFKTSREAEEFASILASDRLREANRFVIYGGDVNVHRWRDWFRGRAELADWTTKDLGPFGDVDAVLFEKPTIWRASR